MRCAPFLASIHLMVAAAAQGNPVTSRGELLTYHTRSEPGPETSWNPGNGRIERRWIGELRPDLHWRGPSARVTLKPRVRLEATPEGSRSESWLNEGWLRLQPTGGWYLQAGREAPLWGPSLFWNPSNPFFLTGSRSDPKREIEGRTFLRGHLPWNDSWSLDAMAQLDNGNDTRGPERRQAVKLSRRGRETDIAMLVSHTQESGLGFHGLVQWIACDAAVLYGELAWAGGLARPRARPLQGPTGWRIELPGRERDLEALAGIGWTFHGGRTLNVECFHHGSGYGTDGLRNVNQASTALSSQIHGVHGGLARSQLGALMIPGQGPLGRRFLGVQLREASGNPYDWMVRYVRSLGDGSGEAVVHLGADAGDRVQLWVRAMVQHGGSGDEYRRRLRSSLQLGLSWFMW